MSRGVISREAAQAAHGFGGTSVNSNPMAGLYARAKERNDELRNRYRKELQHRRANERPFVSIAPDNTDDGREPPPPEEKHSASSPSLPSAPLRSLASGSHPSRTMGIILIDIASVDIKALLDGILSVSTNKNITPIFITDTEEFSVFRERGLFFEHVPSRERMQRFGRDRDWQLYANRRLDILAEKWKIDGFVSFGNEDVSAFETLTPDTPELGFWRRQIVRLFRVALRHQAKSTTLEEPDVDSSVSYRVD